MSSNKQQYHLYDDGVEVEIAKIISVKDTISTMRIKDYNNSLEIERNE